MHNAAYWIGKLGLQPHPEGGHFSETYRASESIEASALPERFSAQRSFATAIYFLLQRPAVSMFHRIQSDEIWHFHTGSPLTIHIIDRNGGYSHIVLGPDPESRHVYQAVVPAGAWFGASVDEREDQDYALVGCTVAPGFDFDDFELGLRSSLLAEFPQHQEIITRLTRDERCRI